MSNPLQYVDEAGDAVRSVIRAYHGSPYDFDRFDASKIGTGEGAQTYGHGLYFAGNEDVAKSYREQLSKGSFMVEGAQSPFTESAMDAIGISTSAQGVIRRALKNGEDPIKRLRDIRGTYTPLSKYHNEYSDALAVLESAGGKIVPNPGRMYEVEIAYPEEAMLDYDKPIWGQSAHVIDGLKKLNAAALGAKSEFIDGPFGGHVWATPKGYIVGTPNPAATPETLSFWDTHQNHRHGGAAIADLNALGATHASASEALRSVGIPGIRYLDGGSRTAGSGTRNYVIFPGAEDSIRILRKYAIPGAVGTGAAAMTGAQNAESR